MKVRNYEKNGWVLLITCLLFMLELILLIYLNKTKEYEYEKITGYLVDKKEIVITPNKKLRKILYQNKKIVIEGHDLLYEIVEDKGVVFRQNNQDYYELILKAKIPSTKDQIVEISIKKNKKRVLELLKSVWKGEIK